MAKKKQPAQEIGFPIELDLSDEDVYQAMKSLPGYLDITTNDFKEIYRLAHCRALDRITHSVKAKDIMTTRVVSVKRDTSLADVADSMARHGISGVPVVEPDGRVAGVISEKDFIAAMNMPEVKTCMGVISEWLKRSTCLIDQMLSRTAEDIMTSPAITVPGETPLAELVEILADKAINRVPVVDAGGYLVGLVSRADVMRFSFLRRVC
ncbi:MAG: CBS domain-containing protein [Deltaproteobacteria bacterium]|nr:CBS domain-containing protein [Deltaproteobacteria bacterium]